MPGMAANLHHRNCNEILNNPEGSRQRRDTITVLSCADVNSRPIWNTGASFGLDVSIDQNVRCLALVD